MADESRTLQLKRFDSLAEAENYAGEKGELTAVYPQGLNLIRTLFLHNGTAGGGVPVSKMIMYSGSIIYVDASKGDDTLTDGRGWYSSKPFKTLRAALYYADIFVDTQGAALTFHFAPGEYTMPDNGWFVPWNAAITFDGTNDDDGEVVFETSGTSGHSWVITGGYVIFRNIHMKSHGYAVINAISHCMAVFSHCTIEHTANDSSSHTMLYAYDKGYILLEAPITFIANNLTGALYILHATRGGEIQLSNPQGTITFTIANQTSNNKTFVLATKAGSVVTPAETAFTIEGDTTHIEAMRVSEGGMFSAHGTVYNSIPQQQPTVADVLGAGAKAVALADDTDEVVYEPDVAYMERQKFFAELDEEYRRVGILSKED